MDTVIKVENIVKRYNELVALDNFNLEVKEGEVFGLLGPNGSGKSTTISCILGLLKYDKGNIEVFGKKMTSDEYGIKKDIGVVMQNVAVFDELTVYENIDYFCGLYIHNKIKRKEYVREAIDFVNLNGFEKFVPGKLSGGLLRRLNIACGIAHKPKLIFMDEPTVAVDPQSRNNILEGIKKLNENGATIVYTSHYMEEVENVCSRISIMDKGKNLAIGTKEELKNTINFAENISVEVLNLKESVFGEIKKLPNVTAVDYVDNNLSVKCTKGQRNLIELLDFLRESNVEFGRVYSELPTLNDVFLEITGKELRDGE